MRFHHTGEAATPFLPRGLRHVYRRQHTGNFAEIRKSAEIHWRARQLRLPAPCQDIRIQVLPAAAGTPEHREPAGSRRTIPAENRRINRLLRKRSKTGKERTRPSPSMEAPDQTAVGTDNRPALPQRSSRPAASPRALHRAGKGGAGWSCGSASDSTGVDLSGKQAAGRFATGGCFRVGHGSCCLTACCLTG